MNKPSQELAPLRHGVRQQGIAQNETLEAAAKGDPRAEGLRLLAEKKHAEAAVILARAAQALPEDWEILLGLGRALCSCSRWAEAEPHLEKAARLQPGAKDTRFVYGDVLLKVGKFEAAETELRAAFRLLPWWKQLTTTVRRVLQPAWYPANPPSLDPGVKLAFARERRMRISYARSCIAAAEPNPAWKASERGKKFSVRKQPIIHKGTRLFAIGSCFALEIRHELMRRGFDVYPKYHAIDFDPTSQILNSLPDRDNINHYDTFTIRQEFENAFGDSHFQPSDFWEVRGRNINKVMGRETVWQDPYRKNVYAADAASIQDLSQKLDACMAEGILHADVYIVTLGLIETWRVAGNNLHACTYPGVGGGGGAAQTELHVAGFQENYENLKRVCELIFTRFPERKMILTVSPVGLERTFRDMDVVIANMESKATLRAVAGQICREFSQAHYLPSFELFMGHDLFHDNGRHATRDGVQTVLDLFSQCFLQQEPTPASPQEQA